MTRVANDERDGPFSDWIRNHPGLDSIREGISVQIPDVVVHRFSSRRERTTIARVMEHLQIVEVKSFCADMPFAQKDTWTVLDLMIRRFSVKGDRRRGIKIADTRPGRSGTKRTVRWLGVHLLQMSHDRPDRSDRMIWDGKYQIDEETLVELLRFDRDPDHPTKLLDIRRHHVRPYHEVHPKLNLVLTT